MQRFSEFVSTNDQRILEEGIMQSVLQGFSNLLGRFGQRATDAFNQLPGGTAEEKLDKLQMALDVAGVEPTVGALADGGNAAISLLRAAFANSTDQMMKHSISAAISLVSIIPFADIVKVLKPINRNLAKAAVKGSRYLQNAAEVGKSLKPGINAAIGPSAVQAPPIQHPTNPDLAFA